MSSFTAQAFVVNGGFGPETRKHPALVFGEEAAKVFDSRDHSTVGEWLTKDFSATQPDGTSSQQTNEAAFKAAKSVHDKLLTAYRHVPSSTVVVETENGYKVMTHAVMYGNLLAVSALNPVKVSDPDGNKWDIMVPTFSEWDLVKDSSAKHHGLLVKHANVVFDQKQILQGAQAKGMDVSGWLKG